MLPKQTVPEGSRKVLNGVEVFTRHNFTTDRGNLFETMDGSYILPNGKPVEDRSILESLPEPQRQQALAWWDQRFGGVEKEEEEEAPPAGRKMTKAELLLQIKFLQEQADRMEDEEEVPEGLTSEVSAPATGQPKDVKESKPSPKRSKKDGEPSVLSQMGIAT